MLLGILFTNFALVRLNRNIQRLRMEKELAQIFFWYWDGTPEDTLYAWYKVRTILKLRDGEKKKIDVVDRKIFELNKGPMFGDFSVSESGELIEDMPDLAINR